MIDPTNSWRAALSLRVTANRTASHNSVEPSTTAMAGYIHPLMPTSAGTTLAGNSAAAVYAQPLADPATVEQARAAGSEAAAAVRSLIDHKERP